MTLLITVAAPNYSLSTSDQRITARYGSKIRIVDENFNKHIYFGTETYGANVSYTGVAQWHHNGKKMRLYDLIAEGISEIISSNPKFASLCLHLINYLQSNLDIAVFGKKGAAFELHINCRHREHPVNTIAVISTFREKPPWSSKSELDYEYQIGSIKVFFKSVIEEAEVVFGGTDIYVQESEKNRILNAVGNGANAYDCTRLMSKLNKSVALKTQSVGTNIASVVIPKNGMVDTNVWDNGEEGWIAYTPQIIYPNGKQMAASKFPANLSMMLDGQLHEQSLFFKSIVAKSCSRRIRRLIFKRRTGPYIPGALGLISLALFGRLPDGFEDFGLGSE